jgi:glutathione synthase/RimK-type ligase-like ATP-grasp enzyme
MLRSSTSDDFRAGITGGGIGSPFKVTPQIAEISESIVRLMRLEAVAGVDLLWQGENVVICEVNSAPGFRGFETYCGIDVAARIAAHVHSLLVNIPTSVIQ